MSDRTRWLCLSTMRDIRDNNMQFTCSRNVTNARVLRVKQDTQVSFISVWSFMQPTCEQKVLLTAERQDKGDIITHSDTYTGGKYFYSSTQVCASSISILCHFSWRNVIFTALHLFDSCGYKFLSRLRFWQLQLLINTKYNQIESSDDNTSKF